ncbi:DgyrCDS1741 [Dimorphilus gyrociliatus]|uniref:DgyrCDS1741 n=1 Tax=Dimorphilus gyrociliatus TaxID=2664684 RepID=A0A7I8V8H7_9ANNE|nr:DgyrCDS1741 [Dimorphilus gyrociliatus]
MAGEMRQLENTPIGNTILSGDYKLLKDVLSSGEDPHYKDRKGNTYLHLASTRNSTYILQILAATLKIDVNGRNKHGFTALHVSALYCQTCIVQDLICIGVDPTIKDNRGQTADMLTDNIYWLQTYNKYYPGLRQAIQDYDLDKVYFLIDSWCSIDAKLSLHGLQMRQYAATQKHHDIGLYFDKMKPTLMAINAVFELNYDKLKEALHNKTLCKINFIRKGVYKQTILQHAIRIGDERIVKMLIEAGSHTNIFVHVKDYFKGPLIFEAFHSSPKILELLLKNCKSFEERDERGRNCLLYLLDLEYNDSNIKYWIRNSDISVRDYTGSSCKDVARLTRRFKIEEEINRQIVYLLRTSNTKELKRLAINCFEDFRFHYEGRDTWLIAHGNKDRESLRFLMWFDHFKKTRQNFHTSIKTNDIIKFQEIIKSKCDSDESDDEIYTQYTDTTDLIQAKDHGGRNCLHLSILFERKDMAETILELSPTIINSTDNLNRTPLHYAAYLKNNDLVTFLRGKNANSLCEDANWNSCENLEKNWTFKQSENFCNTERKAHYGFEKELYYLSIHEDLLRIINDPFKSIRHFNNYLKKLKIKVSDIPNVLMKQNQQILTKLDNLLMSAINNGKEDVALRLLSIGYDPHVSEEFKTENGEVVLKNSYERALDQNMIEVGKVLEKKLNISK